jgi:hypothetical protein
VRGFFCVSAAPLIYCQHTPLPLTRTELEIIKRGLDRALATDDFIKDDGDGARARVLLQTIEKTIFASKAQVWWQGGR